MPKRPRCDNLILGTDPERGSPCAHARTKLLKNFVASTRLGVSRNRVRKCQIACAELGPNTPYRSPLSPEHAVGRKIFWCTCRRALSGCGDRDRRDMHCRSPKPFAPLVIPSKKALRNAKVPVGSIR